MFIGTATMKQPKVTGQAGKKQQSKLECLQNKAEDHQIRNHGRSIGMNTFGDFMVFFFYTVT